MTLEHGRVGLDSPIAMRDVCAVPLPGGEHPRAHHSLGQFVASPASRTSKAMSRDYDRADGVS